MKRIISILLLLAVALSVEAREVFPLNEGWRFFFKSENSSDNARHVTLPHTWNTDTGAAGNLLTTTANYQNDFFIPLDWSSKRLFVKFYGVQTVADVFVNGFYVGGHRGGATAFTLEITDKIRFGSDNALTVVVSNSYYDDILPTSTDINLYGGIYREAELIVTAKTAISPLYFGSDGVLMRQSSVSADKIEGEAEVHLTTSSDESGCLLTLDITSPDGQKVFSRRQKARLDGKPVLIPFQIDNPRLWSPSQPSLYKVSVRVGDDTTIDDVELRTGFRSVAVTPSGGFALNGSRILLRGVSLYHDNATSGGALVAIDYDDDLRQIRDLGANAIHSAVMPHAQYLYNRCDEEGLLVWIDAPFQRASFLGDVAYYPTRPFEQNGLQQLQEIIAQNFNHPSVVVWGIFSRLWMRGDDVIPYLKQMNEAAHKMDPSRPTVAQSDQDGNINFITDLIVWRQNVGWFKGSPADVKVWRDQLQKNWSRLRSGISYGGSGFVGHKNNTAATQPGQRSNWLPEERQTRFHEEYARILNNDSLFWGTWINNMFDYGSARRPYGVNGAGLMTLDRRTGKDAYYLYRALWNEDEPTLHLADKRQVLREGVRQAFAVYSSVGLPTLYVGRDTVTLREYGPCQYRSDSVALQGIVEVKVVAGGLRDSVTIRIGNSLKPKSYRGPQRRVNQ